MPVSSWCIIFTSHASLPATLPATAKHSISQENKSPVNNNIIHTLQTIKLTGQQPGFRARVYTILQHFKGRFTLLKLQAYSLFGQNLYT
jgi:hypothetical protein